jgi:hypothetical protein
MTGGAGGDWGQRVGSEYFVSALDNPHIWLHEFVSFRFLIALTKANYSGPHHGT